MKNQPLSEWASYTSSRKEHFLENWWSFPSDIRCQTLDRRCEPRSKCGYAHKLLRYVMSSALFEHWVGACPYSKDKPCGKKYFKKTLENQTTRKAHMNRQTHDISQPSHTIAYTYAISSKLHVIQSNFFQGLLSSSVLTSNLQVIQVATHHHKVQLLVLAGNILSPLPWLDPSGMMPLHPVERRLPAGWDPGNGPKLAGFELGLWPLEDVNIYIIYIYILKNYIYTTNKQTNNYKHIQLESNRLAYFI